MTIPVSTRAFTTKSPASHPYPDRRGDLVRLALLLMIFLNAVLGLALVARDHPSFTHTVQTPDPSWRGNAGPSN